MSRSRRQPASSDRQQPPPLLSAHAARFRARLAADPSEAEAHFAHAKELFRKLEMIFWLAVAQLEQAEWLMTQERAAEAQPLLDEAAEMFVRLEATPWIERAQRVLTQGREPEALVET